MQEAFDQPLSPSIDSLRQGRQELAALLSENQLRSVFSFNRIDDPNVALTKVPNESFGYDCRVLRACDYMSLEAVGVNTNEFAAKLISPDDESQPLEAIDLADEHMIIEKYGNGMSLHFKKDGQEGKYPEPKPERIRDLVSKRFASSPGHSELFRINNQLKEGNKYPQEASTEPIDPKEDPIGTLSFLEDIGLIYPPSSLSKVMADGLNINDTIEKALGSIPDYRAETNDTETDKVFKWGKGIVKQLKIDKQTGNYIFSVSQNPEANYPEVADQSPQAESLPFIETECAEELNGLLDSAGLMFHPALQANMMEIKEADRYGSIYTQLSREVAKWVNSPDRTRLSNLVVPIDQDYFGNKLAEKYLLIHTPHFMNMIVKCLQVRTT